MRGAVPPLPQNVFVTCCSVKPRDNFISEKSLSSERPEREADHSLPSGVPRSRMRGAISPHPICLHGVVLS
jgi:hypothetical protein